MKRLIILPLLFFTLSIVQITAQQKYTIDVSKANLRLESGCFKMGNPGPADKPIEVNNQYLTIGKKPVIPIMGELHYARLKPEQWEDCILKMKACGINIIATYLFWNHHEETEGQFTWTGDKDLRAFIQLCQKHGMSVYPRIGPWSHGEARNGGTPDWILRKKFLKDRSNDPVYQNYVVRYFGEVANQMKGLYYKDGGNIIGIQLENEYWYAKDGEPHIQWLKDAARACGIDVPLYTVTGWGGGSVPPYEVIPLWGGYADEPWIESVEKHVLPFYFQFDSFRDSKHIGNDQIDRKEEYMTYERYPYFTCEMGVGIPMMYHRRIVLSPIDGLGMILAKLGSGSNLLGYYMFAGGTNPRGELHSTEEEQEETGYWSRTPAKSYDFRAAIRESGELDPSYNQVKKLHYFVNSFEENLAPMIPTLARTKEDDLQYAVRSDGESAFLFGINYTRYVPKPVRKNVQFSVKFKGETLQFPQTGVDIPDSTVFIWPVNLKMDDALLKYATAQPLSKIENTYIFFQNKTVRPEFAFDASTVNDVQSVKATVNKKGNLMMITDIQPGKDCFIDVVSKNGSKLRILVLNEEDATNSWVLERSGKKEFYISESNMYVKLDSVYAFTSGKDIKVYEMKQDGFTEHNYQAGAQGEIKLTAHPLFADAKWLETANFKNIPAYQVRHHRFFIKEFSLDNPSAFRKATLYIYPESDCKLHMNDKWIRQDVKPGQINAIDITGYVTKGENMMFVDFPYIEGNAKFAARVIVEYSNYDRIEFSTDKSWLAADMYTNPSSTRAHDRPLEPVIVDEPVYAKTLNYPIFSEWDINIPWGSFEKLSALYTHIRYAGDRAELYNGHILSADSFNDNTPWQIGLQRIIPKVEGQKLRLVVYPLSEKTKMYFDVKPSAGDYNKAEIKSFETKREYSVKIK